MATTVDCETFEEWEIVICKLHVIIDEHKKNPFVQNLLASIGSSLILNINTHEAVITGDDDKYELFDRQEKSLAISVDALVCTFKQQE